MPDKVCAYCGKMFVVPSPKNWTYKMKGLGEDRHRNLSFCCFSCQEGYKKKFPDRKEYNSGFKQ